MIRELTVAEVPWVIAKIGLAFFTEARLPGTFQQAGFTDYWQQMVASGTGVLLAARKADADVGWLGGVVVPDAMTGDLMGMEMFWYALPEARGSGAIRLLPAFEEWVKRKGGARLWMVNLCHLNAEQMARLYEGHGYSRAEQFWRKELR